MDPANRVILVLLAVVVVLAGLVFLFGYPLLIWVAVLASFAAIGLLVYISAGDFGQQPEKPVAAAAPKRAAKAV